LVWFFDQLWSGTSIDFGAFKTKKPGLLARFFVAAR